MAKKGWLVNDALTCIKDTRTLWHDLLDWIPSLEDKTGGRTDFSVLAQTIESQALINPPDYILRNATFFRPMHIPAKTISFLQDSYPAPGNAVQIQVCNASDAVIFNSPFTRAIYEPQLDPKIPKFTISIGTDFDLFKPMDKEACRQEMGILPNSILFVGDSSFHPKGFDLVKDIINDSNFNFCLVMKDNFSINNERIKTFNRVSHAQLVKIYNACEMLICTSVVETLHLSGIEAAACGLPIVAPNIGIYYREGHDAGMWENVWGLTVPRDVQSYKAAIVAIRENMTRHNPRQFFLDSKLDLNGVKHNWINTIKDIVGE